MKKVDVQELYRESYVDNNFERADLFETLKIGFNINNALYPGSFAHVTPSFFIPEVVYVDTDKRAKKFFEQKSKVADLIAKKKTYETDAVFHFISSDYSRPLDLKEKSFDLLISQYAGFVSQECKRYLKIGGILLANNSHGDAGMAFIDDDYEFIAAVYLKNRKFHITEKDLDSYFIPKKQIQVTKDHLAELKKGIVYTKTANSYIFRRIS
jgi:SAM-dependent methyltransferase